MNLLLLLSALLSAFTGAGMGTRAQDRAPTVAEAARAAASATVAAPRITVRPVATLPILAANAAAPAAKLFALVPGEPLYATRRRE